MLTVLARIHHNPLSRDQAASYLTRERDEEPRAGTGRGAGAA